MIKKSCLILFGLIFTPNAQAQVAIERLSVSGDVWATAAPDVCRVTLELESQQANASEAINSLTKRSKDVLGALAKESSSVSEIIERGSLLDGATPGSSITTNAVVSARRFLAFETKDLDSLGRLIDTTLQAGADSVTDVSCYVADSKEAKEKAILEATAQAKAKASALAKASGITLGKIVAIDVSEDRAGAVLRQKQQRGRVIPDYRSEDYHIYVTLQYEMAPTN